MTEIKEGIWEINLKIHEYDNAAKSLLIGFTGPTKMNNINYDEIIKNCLVIDGAGNSVCSHKEVTKNKNYTKVLAKDSLLKIRVNMNSRLVY